MLKLIQTIKIPWWKKDVFSLALSNEEGDDCFYYKRYVINRQLDPIIHYSTSKDRFTDLQITFTEEETV